MRRWREGPRQCAVDRIRAWASGTTNTSPASIHDRRSLIRRPRHHRIVSVTRRPKVDRESAIRKYRFSVRGRAAPRVEIGPDAFLDMADEHGHVLAVHGRVE